MAQINLGTINDTNYPVDATTGELEAAGLKTLQTAVTTAEATSEEVLACINSSELSAGGSTEKNQLAIKKALAKAIYTSEFQFSGEIRIFQSTPFNVERNKDKPSRIEMRQGDQATVTAENVGSAFGLSKEVIAKLGSGSISLTDFMMDLKTKEYAVGVSANDPLSFLDAIGLSFVGKIIKIKSADIYLANKLTGSVAPIAEATT